MYHEQHGIYDLYLCSSKAHSHHLVNSKVLSQLQQSTKDCAQLTSIWSERHKEYMHVTAAVALTGDTADAISARSLTSSITMPSRTWIP